jgi:ATP-dependent exoDNAse (exonuclease V) beta subunit
MPSLDHRKPPPTLNPEKVERLIVHGYFNENVEEEQEKEMIRILYVGLTRVQDLIRLSRPLTRSEKSMPNALFTVGSTIFDVEHIETIYPSIMQNPLSASEGLLLNLRTRLEDSIGELRHGFETEDLAKSVRTLLIYHLEQLVVNEHSIDNELRKLVQDFESLVGRVEYHEFTGDVEVAKKQTLWRPKRYTWSMLDAYRRCPQKFAFSHVHNLVSNNNKSLTVGNLVHEIVEKIGSLSKKPTGKEFDEIIDESLRNHVNKLPLLGDEKIEEIKEKVSIWNDSERSRNKVIATEQGLEFEFYDRKFYGKIDRVETDSKGNLRMIDFKTGKANKKPGNMGQEQLLLYAHAWEQNTGESPDIIAYDFVMENMLAETDVKSIMLEKGLARLIPTIEGIDANQFEAIPDKQTCQYCDFSGLCPERY